MPPKTNTPVSKTATMFDLKARPSILKTVTAPQPTPRPASAPAPVARSSKTVGSADADLSDYDVVPPDKWRNLEYNRFVRYVRADTGVLIKGGNMVGYIKKNGKDAISLTADGSNDKRVVWSIPLESIKVMYARKVQPPKK